MAEEAVAHRARQRVFQLAQRADAPGTQDVPSGALHPDGFVGTQAGLDRGGAGERLAENDAVLDGLAAALAEVVGHRVGGVAQQRDPSVPPPLERVAIGDVGANDVRFFRRFDHRLDRIEELATALQDGGLDRAWSVGLPLRCVGDRLPVHTLATDPVEEEPSAAPPLEPERAALGT